MERLDGQFGAIRVNSFQAEKTRPDAQHILLQVNNIETPGSSTDGRGDRYRMTSTGHLTSIIFFISEWIPARS
jgi:hypothetical protein